jgi:hypothetical protein
MVPYCRGRQATTETGSQEVDEMTTPVQRTIGKRRFTFTASAAVADRNQQISKMEKSTHARSAAFAIQESGLDDSGEVAAAILWAAHGVKPHDKVAFILTPEQSKLYNQAQAALREVSKACRENRIVQSGADTDRQAGRAMRDAAAPAPTCDHADHGPHFLQGNVCYVCGADLTPVASQTEVVVHTFAFGQSAAVVRKHDRVISRTVANYRRDGWLVVGCKRGRGGADVYLQNACYNDPKACEVVIAFSAQ